MPFSAVSDRLDRDIGRPRLVVVADNDGALIGPPLPV